MKLLPFHMFTGSGETYVQPSMQIGEVGTEIEVCRGREEITGR